MTEKEFEDRFTKAWKMSMSKDDIDKIVQNAANSVEPGLVVAKILMDYQLRTTKAVLKEFFLNNAQ